MVEVDLVEVFLSAPAVHPATWFKVEFSDQKIVTFRPSALCPVDDKGEPISIPFSRVASPVKSPPVTREKHLKDSPPTGEWQ